MISYLCDKSSNLSVVLKCSVTQRTPTCVHIFTLQFRNILGVNFLQWANNTSLTAWYNTKTWKRWLLMILYLQTWNRQCKHKAKPLVVMDATSEIRFFNITIWVRITKQFSCYSLLTVWISQNRQSHSARFNTSCCETIKTSATHNRKNT